MPRYIQEYNIGVEGGTLTVPTCAKFLGVAKVSSHFVLIAEIWGNPGLVYDIDVKVFRKDEYIKSEANYIGNTLVGTNIYHFCFTHGEVIDLGGDGGMPESAPEKPIIGTTSVEMVVKAAGGMREI